MARSWGFALSGTLKGLASEQNLARSWGFVLSGTLRGFASEQKFEAELHLQTHVLTSAESKALTHNWRSLGLPDFAPRAQE